VVIGLPDVVNFLSAISSIAVIAGAGFIVLQLRQNARLIEASTQQQKADAAFSMLEKITHESFARRRYNMYEVVKRYQAKNWEGFLDSSDDFEVRNFAYLYELYGLLVKEGLIEFRLVAETLKYLVVFDWKAFEPACTYLVGKYGLKANPWGSFEWLAQQTQKYLAEKEAAVT
jgi:hypothetical protein